MHGVMDSQLSEKLVKNEIDNETPFFYDAAINCKNPDNMR